MRVLASIAFLFGGVAMWFLIGIAHGYGASQAAMSAGPVSGASPGEVALPWLVSFYFALSAVGVLIKNRQAVLAVATVAHLFLFFAVLMFCSGASGLFEALMGAGLVIAVFSPWFCIWGFTIWGRTRNDAV